MKQEYSYGAVVYKIENGVRLYLIEKMALGHVSIPKGHIEEGETPIQCTNREILEETGLTVDLDTGFSHTITYSPAKDVRKDVTFYVAEISGGTEKAQKEEVAEILYLPFEEAYGKLTHESDRKTLELADKYLDRQEKASR